jgi:hypothetical protein
MKQKIKDRFKGGLGKATAKVRGAGSGAGEGLRSKLPGARRRNPDNKYNQALENLPRITNETVAEHREEMLSSARKFIYPLQHSRTRIVRISVTLAIIGLVVFVAYILVALYKLQSSSTFIYGVTRVLPLPVAKAGSSWISYESYLFELRHLTHYYETQQEVNFGDENGQKQLQNFRQRAMQQVIDDAYVKQLAKQHNVSVSDREVDDAVTLLRNQNRLGNGDEEFADVLKEFWGWTVTDFRRELRQQILAQKVVAKLDTETGDRARQAEARLKSGQDFAKVSAEMSDDQATKGSGGEYPFLIDRNTRDLSPKVVDALFRLQPGQVSGIVDTGYSLEIARVNAVAEGKLRAAHISFNYAPLKQFIDPLSKQNPASKYIEV